MTGQDAQPDGLVETAAALGCGMEQAARWLEQVGGLRGVLLAEPSMWSEVAGVGPSTAQRLHAAARLGAQAVRAGPSSVTPIHGPERAAALLVPRLSGLTHEELHALYLDRRQRVLAHRRLTVGSDRFTVVDPPQIFRPAVALGACAVVLAHNHPSGDPTPSSQDREVTRRVAQAGHVLGIQLVDHLVIGQGDWTSMARRRELDGPGPPQLAWTS